MSLTSFLFIILFILSLGIYYITPKRYQWCALLFFSISFFAACCKPWTIVYVIVSTVSARITCNAIHSNRSIWDEKKLKRCLAAGLAVNLGILCLLKYLNFFIFNIDSLLSVFGMQGIPLTDLAAPIGVSFYTLQTVAYILDVYWGITEPQEGYLKTGLFTSVPIEELVLDRRIKGSIVEIETITKVRLATRLNLGAIQKSEPSAFSFKKGIANHFAA